MFYVAGGGGSGTGASLSAWMRPLVSTFNNFGKVAESLGKFFRAHGSNMAVSDLIFLIITPNIRVEFTWRMRFSTSHSLAMYIEVLVLLCFFFSSVSSFVQAPTAPDGGRENSARPARVRRSFHPVGEGADTAFTAGASGHVRIIHLYFSFGSSSASFFASSSSSSSSICFTCTFSTTLTSSTCTLTASLPSLFKSLSLSLSLSPAHRAEHYVFVVIISLLPATDRTSCPWRAEISRREISPRIRLRCTPISPRWPPP